MTNFERIKAMSIEEMAVMLADEIPHGDCNGCDQCVYLEKPYRLRDKCQEGWLEWLEREAVKNDIKETVVEKREYTIVQCSNNHVHIYKDGRMIYHASCNEKMTEKELLDYFCELQTLLNDETGKFYSIFNDESEDDGE